MKNIFYIILFLFIVVGIDCKEIKTKYGVNFELSEECVFDSDADFKEDQWDDYYYKFRFKEFDYEIDLTRYDIDYIITEYGEDYYNKVKKNIENKNKEYKQFPPGEPVIFIKNGKTNGINYQSVYLTGFYAYDGMIGLRLIFFKDTIPFSISIYHYCDEPRFYNGKLYEEDKNNLRLRVNSIINSYSKGSEKNKNEASTIALNQISNEINLIIEGKKVDNLFPEQLIYLFTIYNKIVSTLNFSEPKINYKTIVCNTILREDQTKDSKTIKKNEIVKLLAFGKYNVIDKIDGLWVKVETEKGEIGWCFDAYLEEIKE